MSKIKVEPILAQPTEPTTPLRFLTKKSLKAHYEKHALDEQEVWETLNPKIKQKEGELIYQELIEKASIDVTKKKQNHIHTCIRELLDSNETYGVSKEVVYGWSTEKKIFFILVRFVRNSNPLLYYIVTGFRLDITAAPKKIQRLARRKIYAKSFQNGEKIIADHTSF